MMQQLKLDWNTIDIGTPYIKPYMATDFELQGYDSHLKPFAIFPNISTYWNYEPKPSFPYYDRPDFVGGVLVETNLD